MKIALIDTGVTKKETKDKKYVRHFSLCEKMLIEKYQKPKDNHGMHCFREIVSNIIDQEIQILDLNIFGKTGNIQVSDIITAIEKSIEERVDIINISLGITSYSQELYEVCEKAVNNNIVILSAASHINTISFPADLKNVICVKVDQNQKERIKTIDNTTLSVSMRDFIVKEEDEKFDFSSSSLACARVCGYLCNDLADMPLNNKFKILACRYNININSADEINYDNNLKKSEIDDILLNNRVAVVLFPVSDLEKVNKKNLNRNIVAYFDHKKGDFYSFSDDELIRNFDIILVINSTSIDLEVPNIIKEEYNNYEIICIGKFLKSEDNALLLNYNDFESSKMSILEKPVIAIMSLCSGLNKSDIHIELLNNLKKDGLEVEAISNNPIGLLYNMDIFEYPYKLIFPDIVYSINYFMYLSEMNKEIDTWLINIGGAIGQVNNLNTYNFGKLVDAYLSAMNIDVAVMCVNPSVDVSNLKLQLAHLYKHGIKEIFIVLSYNDINTTTTDYRDGLQTYRIDKSKYNEAFEYLQKSVDEKIFNLADVKEGKLYTNIINALS